jgi:hypothetical protein
MEGDPPEALAIKAKIRDAWDREVAARAAMNAAAREATCLRRELAILAFDLKMGGTYRYKTEKGDQVGILQPHNDFHLFSLQLLSARTKQPSKASLIVRHLDSLELVPTVTT